MPAPKRPAWPILVLVACGPSSTTDSGQDGSGSAAETSTTGSGHGTSGGPTNGESSSAGSSDADGSSSTSGTSPAVCPPPAQTFEQTSAPCRGGTELQQGDAAGPSGLAHCPDGSVHSYGIACCGADRHPTCPGTATEGSCAVDADCDAAARGECRSFEAFGGVVCNCVYGACVTDADCDAGDACLCAADSELSSFEVARCVAADCRTDADCGGFRCALSGRDCTVPYELHCHGADDECQSDADCDKGTFCEFAPESARWACVGQGPPCD